MTKEDEKWMRRALVLAHRGSGTVSPNPMVGAVIVKNGKKISEGFHRNYGGPHAEIEAINDAQRKGKDLRGATVYVTLEPCSHFGKTPPCADALIREGVTRVVAAVQDPNPLVAGKGLKKLRAAGIAVRTNVLRKEASALNRHFFTAVTEKRPFVAIKAAQTADGFIARPDGSSRWITNAASRTFVHRLRTEFDAVLVGAGTVTADDPQLTVRAVSGRNPVRIILDGACSVPEQRSIFSRDARTIIYTTQRGAASHPRSVIAWKKQGVEVVVLKGRGTTLDLTVVMDDLREKRIGSVLVEGGASTYAAFLKEKFVDDLYLFTAQKRFSDGIRTFPNGKRPRGPRRSVRLFGTDRLEIFTVRNR